MVNYDDNPQALRAIEAIEGGDNVCLIGKAGSGKTTLVHHIREKMRDTRIAVLAPTGIAAINANGKTIHSLFKFPFRTLTPAKDWGERRFMTYDSDDIAALKLIDLLIIDEISMVRADIFDAMNVIMQLVRENEFDPFGGMQVLIVGDPFQLPPVVTNNKHEDEKYTDKELMDKTYSSPFFFDAEMYWKEPFTVVELTHIYRQEVGAFVDVLNNIRDGVRNQTDLELLNARVQKTDEDNIYLTSTRKSCDSINDRRMASIDEPSKIFKSKKTGFFPFSMIPQDSKEIEIKVGARVMTTFNDPQSGFVNGTIGTVLEIKVDHVVVDVDDDYVLKYKSIHVPMVTLQNFNSKGVQIGTYKFLPIRHAWAITIHKSQGLTFSKVNICPKKIFASGQLYVALSRCRSLEGMILTDPILPSYIKVSKRIQQFMQKVESDGQASKP